MAENGPSKKAHQEVYEAKGKEPKCRNNLKICNERFSTNIPTDPSL